MKNLKKFILKNGYALGNILEYNSYKTGTRSETRDYDSISVTELLDLIIDPNLDFVKSMYGQEIKSACKYGTKKHNDFEQYLLGGNIENTPINIQFKKCLIQNDINISDTEKDFSIDIGLPFPLTAKIDAIGKIGGIENVIDWKTTKNKRRNFISQKQKLQIELYKYLSGIKYGTLVYINQSSYSIIKVGYYRDIVSELIEYAKILFNKNMYYDKANNIKRS